MLETTGFGIGGLLNSRNGLDRWTAGVTSPEIFKLVTRMFDGGRIRKKGNEYGRSRGKERNKRIIRNWIKWYLDRRQNKEKDIDYGRQYWRHVNQ